MSKAREQLFQDAINLDLNGRAELAALLIESLDPTSTWETEDELLREFDRRQQTPSSREVNMTYWDAMMNLVRCEKIK